MISRSDRSTAKIVGLTVVVHDVDRPNELIVGAFTSLDPVGGGRKIRPSALSDSVGRLELVAPDSGEFHAKIQSLNHDQLEVRVRLEQDCQQVLEVYIRRPRGEGLIVTFDRAPEPNNLPSATAARAVLTTCAPLNERAHVRTPGRDRLDFFPRPRAATLVSAIPIATIPTGVRVCLDCSQRQIPPGAEPALIVKDSAARVLAMIPPGDTSVFASLDAEMISGIEVVQGGTLAPVLGRGFENGLIIITLTPTGTVAWRRLPGDRQTKRTNDR